MKEQITNGMRWNKDVSPRTLQEREQSGRFLWDSTIETLPQAIEEFGKKFCTIILNSSDLRSLPFDGLTLLLGENVFQQMLDETNIQENSVGGYIVCNGNAILMAAWYDRRYWPNTERGGH